MKAENLSDLLSSSGFVLGRIYNFDAIITNVNEKLTKNDKKYLIFTLVAGLESVEGRKWGVELQDQSIFQQGKCVQVVGRFQEYQSKVQFIVERAVVVEDQDRRQNLLPTAPNHHQLCKELNNFFTHIEDPDYKKIIDHVFSKSTLEKFQSNRAALKNHHNVYGGLLWHTVTMLKVAESILDIYNYLPINRSLLYAGIIFHDVGKIAEIGDYFQNKYSLRGELIGHIVIGAEVVGKVGKKLEVDPKKIILLQHLILASHGKLENASPVEPKTIESLILSHLDNLDAKIGAIFIEMNKLSPSENSIQEVRLDGKLLNFHFHHSKK